MYKETIALYNQGRLEDCAKNLVRYFPLVLDKETPNNVRYCTFKISENNKWKFATFKKHNGEVLSIKLTVNREDF